jgi:hypothetical protein
MGFIFQSRKVATHLFYNKKLMVRIYAGKCPSLGTPTKLRTVSNKVEFMVESCESKVIRFVVYYTIVSRL